jgi:hypothetical protein
VLYGLVVGVFFAGCGALLVNIGYDSLSSTKKRVQSLERKIEEADLLIQKVRASSDQLGEFSKEEARLEGEFEMLARILPLTVVPETEVTRIAEQAAMLDLDAFDFQVDPRQHRDFYSETEVQFLVDGATAEELDELVNKINAMVPMRKVVGLEIGARANRAWVSVELYELREFGAAD